MSVRMLQIIGTNLRPNYRYLRVGKSETDVHLTLCVTIRIVVGEVWGIVLPCH